MDSRLLPRLLLTLETDIADSTSTHTSVEISTSNMLSLPMIPPRAVSTPISYESQWNHPPQALQLDMHKRSIRTTLQALTTPRTPPSGPRTAPPTPPPTIPQHHPPLPHPSAAPTPTTRTPTAAQPTSPRSSPPSPTTKTQSSSANSTSAASAPAGCARPASPRRCKP